MKLYEKTMKSDTNKRPETKRQFFLILRAIQLQRGAYMVISFNFNTYLSKSIASYSSFFKK